MFPSHIQLKDHHFMGNEDDLRKREERFRGTHKEVESTSPNLARSTEYKSRMWKQDRRVNMFGPLLPSLELTYLHLILLGICLHEISQKKEEKTGGS